MGGVNPSHKQVHNPPEEESGGWLQDGDDCASSDFFAEVPLLLPLAVVQLVGQVAHHHSDADGGDDAEGGSSEGRDDEPSPQHAQGIAVEDGATDHQDSDPHDTTENRECGH